MKISLLRGHVISTSRQFNVTMQLNYGKEGANRLVAEDRSSYSDSFGKEWNRNLLLT